MTNTIYMLQPTQSTFSFYQLIVMLIVETIFSYDVNAVK